MTTFDSYEKAYERMTTRNKAYKLAGNRKDLAVLVEGPGEGEYSVMPIKEAIENDFLYEWAA